MIKFFKLLLILSFVIEITFPSNLNIAQSGWELLNPYPYPEWLQDVSFEDANKGIAVGGGVLTTTDGGTNWTIRSFGTDRLVQVEHLSPGVAVAVGENGSIVRTNDGGMTWSTITSGIIDYLFALAFVDQNIGYALGNNNTESGPENYTLFKTTNGGLSWISSSVEVTGNPILTNMDFGDSNHGIIVGFDDDAQTEIVIRTSDGGDTWASLSTGEWRNLESVHMFDSSNALIVGYGRLLRTADGGETVIPVSSVPKNVDGFDIPLEAIKFFDSNVGIILGGVADPSEPGGPIYMTTDGGATWTGKWPVSEELSFMYGISFADTNTITVVGQAGDIVRSTDGGSTWTRQSSTMFPRYWGIETIYFQDENNGWAGGGNQVMSRTKDGGMTWSNISVGSIYESIWDFEFVDANIGFIVGGGYNAQFNQTKWILSTTDGGDTWSSIFNGSGDRFTAIEMLDAQTGVVVGFNGQIYRTTDGSTWVPVTSGTNEFLFDVAFGDANVGITVGDVLLRTTDSGESWSQIAIPNFSMRLSAVTFASPVSVFAVGDGYSIIHSSDGGSTWSQQSNGIPLPDFEWFRLRDIEFVDEYTGIAVGDDGVILHTSNSGETWTRLEGPYQPFHVNLIDIHFVDANTAYIGGDNGTLLKTTSGGVTLVEESVDSKAVPVDFTLFQNYPNPFNPTTSISYNIPNNGYVSLRIYDLLGNEVAVLEDGYRSAGIYTHSFDAGGLSSGIYFYTLKSGKFNATKKMLLVK